MVKLISPRCDLHYVLVFPGVHSSTPEAYAAIDESARSPETEYLSLDELESVYKGPVKDWNFINDFTPVIAAKYSKVQQALDDVKASGALFCDMSGSGSTVLAFMNLLSRLKTPLIFFLENGTRLYYKK